MRIVCVFCYVVIEKKYIYESNMEYICIINRVYQMEIVIYAEGYYIFNRVVYQIYGKL